MNVLLFASDSKYFKYLNPIHKKLIDRNHNSFFLFSEENMTQFPTHNMGNYKCSCNFEYDFKSDIISKSLNIPIPFIPDYLIIARERWQPEQSIIQEFKERFNSKIVLIEVNSQFNNVIESRLEMISRTKYPQNMVDIIFDHSNFIVNTRKQALNWNKWNNSYVVGNPCYDDLDTEVKDKSIYEKYNIDKTKKQILFFSLINMDRPIALKLLENLAKKCGDEYQIFYKPFSGEPFRGDWHDDFHPKFIVDNVTVIYDHLDLFPMYNICDIHVGCISSVVYPSLLLNKKVININNFCKYLDKGNDIEVYKKESYSEGGGGDGSAQFWMRVHKLNNLQEFEDLVDPKRIKIFKINNQHIKSLISECTYDYDYDLNFLKDNTPKDYSKLLNVFDQYNDKNASERIVKKLEGKL